MHCAEGIIMLESLWSSETKPGSEGQPEQAPEEQVAPIAEDEAQPEETEETGTPVALAVSADDFSALEDRVLRAVEMLKHERQARAAAEVRIAEAEERAAQAEEQLGPVQTQLDQQTSLIAQLQNEIFSLRAERDTVRHRVERLLEQLDSLEI
jgi:chromosome segregation ATPase